MAKDSKKKAAKAPSSAPAPTLELPDSNFLSKLTQRIEAGVRESKTPSHSKKTSKEQPSKTSSKTAHPPPKPHGAKVQINGKADHSAQLNDDKRGKKRDRSGSIIESKSPAAAPPAKKTHIRFDNDDSSKATVTKPKSAKKGGDAAQPDGDGNGHPKTTKDALLQEIIALGGTEEDLELVEGLDTDSDQEETVVKETGKVKNANRKDIEAFMKEIGLTGANFEDARTADDAEEAEDEGDGWTDEDGAEDDGEDEEEEDSEEEGDSEDTDSPAPLPVAPTPTAQLTKLPTKGSLTLDPQQDWHNIILPGLPSSSETLTPPAISSLHTRGKDLLAAENGAYMSHNLSKDSNLKFLSEIMKSGTVEDKISALTIVCTDSPLHTYKTLESLLNLAKKKSRNQTIASLTAIKDLFANGTVLPSDRKLLPFGKQPLAQLLAYEKANGASQIFKAYLLLWSFEDWLKDFYFEVLKTLEIVANDEGVTWVRQKAVEMVFELLKQKPEGEVNLMRLLVNKLGDPDRKVASKTSHLLLQLMVAHPAMKSTIISSIESDALLKSSKNAHAKYYSIITLNQTILTRADDHVANQLLNIYFALFADILGQTKAPPPKQVKPADGKLSKKAKKRLDQDKKDAALDEEHNSKLISGVLTGVNRAFPFASIDDDVFNKHLDTLFRITHGSNFNTSLQALTLIFQVSSSKQMVSDRFYRSLYESLLDPRLSTSSKQAMYLNLLFRALKSDHRLARVQAFVKRIVQTAAMHQPPFICGVLYLLRELEGTFPTLKNVLDKPLEDDSDEEVFRDVDDGEGGNSRDSAATSNAQTEATPAKKSHEYDGRKRDPLFANADRSSLWELIPFLSHFHPTVALYANSLHGNTPMPSKPDLSLHTLTHFLDRFVYRNAKTAATNKGSSIMQPLAGGDTRGILLNTKAAGRGLVPVNSEAFSNMKEEDVKEDEVFFHKFFTMRKQGDASRTKQDKKKKNQDGDEEGSEFDDDEVWGAMVESRPDLDADIDDDGDVDMDDFDNDGMDEDMSDLGSDEESIEGPALTTDALGELDDEDMDEDGEEDDGSDGDEFDGFGLDDSDAEAGIGSEDEIPSDVDAKIPKAPATKSGKSAAADAREEAKERRNKLKNLPVFASADDYAALLADEDDEDL
ncbi:Ribosome biogenesis protein NOC1 [Drechslerella dactyloides]|uniref:Ribosome biogenesis protein NOC1 n=1 Tax=Drechslerella dactyloides TaxID=74499 RepID=A0AAD6IXS4_DREDA|nr:Ribosome biogenesis protein NOC1 [Drechslerella dactyloides]